MIINKTKINVFHIKPINFRIAKFSKNRCCSKIFEKLKCINCRIHAKRLNGRGVYKGFSAKDFHVLPEINHLLRII